MQISDLAPSPVIFSDDTHEYYTIDSDFEQTFYSGVTSILAKVLFPDKYKDVDPEVLSRAAARGTRIHQLCQATDTIPTTPEEGDEIYHEEVDNYIKLKADNGISMIANEYLVSHEDWQVASQIDCVDRNLNLYDIKTTYSLDKEYVSWQLSLYAHMFEHQNPTLKAGKLYAVWLRGDKAALVEVPRKSSEQIAQLIGAWQDGDVLTQAEDEDVAYLVNIEEQIADLKEQLKTLEGVRALALEPIQAKMVADGVKSIDNDRIKITIVADSVTSKFDSKRFKTDHADLYSQYVTDSTRAGYIKTTLL